MRIAPVCEFTWRSTNAMCPLCGYTSPLESVSVRGIFAAALKQIAATAVAARCVKRKIFAVADREIDLDRIELRNRGQHRLRADQISDLRRGLTGDTGNERPDLA